MIFSFSKYQGTGNDFILIDDRSASFPLKEGALIQTMCDRKYGIGADGFILLQNSAVCDYRMRIFNSDGKETECCGNGLRCLVQFLKKKHLLSPKGAFLETQGGPVFGKVQGEKVFITWQQELPPLIHFQRKITGVPWAISQVNTGVPHVVVFVPSVQKISLRKWGKMLRSHPLFSPQGTNVNFVEKKAELFSVRTFERGVEAETLACGTGAMAVALLAKHLFQTPSPIKLQFPGGEIEIYMEEGLTMKGEAVCVFEGTYLA